MLDWILIGIQAIIVTIQGVLLYRHIKYKENYSAYYTWGLTVIVLILMVIVIIN